MMRGATRSNRKNAVNPPATFSGERYSDVEHKLLVGGKHRLLNRTDEELPRLWEEQSRVGGNE